MPKKLIKRWLPDHHTLKSHKHLQVFGDLLHDGNLWHLNRRSVTKAFAIGLFMAFVPVPFQMLLAAGTAIWLHANLPLSVALVWLSNPITIPPIFYGCYKLGTLLLNVPPKEFTFQLSWAWITESLTAVWAPFLLGCLVCAVFFSTLGYLGISTLWKLNVSRNWRNRKQRNS
ncbi:DUF2062 domain-containing protein [Thalassotalea mangrovi]|uniref:DUF2062 domain-containing protein n=1 Tax=Thalassotalea mangrovi TaxID=2572245 RepID=A0A4U1B3L3_9GAMM|nr:DUF2062 domain-containing protein [Thalassotalea mangrovi]TKB44116.1 DUF2062 domain-containing protein [Thalassotalea mangrovi]